MFYSTTNRRMGRPRTLSAWHLLLGPALLASAVLAVRPQRLAAQRPLNLDFERLGVEGATRPWGWFTATTFSITSAASSAVTVVDSTERHAGRRSLRITLPPADSTSAPPASQSLRLQVPAQFAAGRPVRVTGWIKTADLDGGARLSLEAWRDYEVLAADSTAPETAWGAGGTTPWTRHQLQVFVDSTARFVVITAAGRGSGTAWFDDLTLEVDGTPVDAVPAGGSPPTSADLDWLARHATPFRTVDPAAPAQPEDFSDLVPVARIVGDALIVALGEATHGTSEFFRMKHRLLRYFVEELGATVFAIEANQLAVERINAYVHGGAGEARDVMRAMFQVWNTEEMLALVEWMRGYNADHPERPVDFIGYDMQEQKLPIDSVRAFLARVEPSLVALADSLYRDYRQARLGFMPQLPDSTRAVWRRNAETMWRLVSDRRETWLAGAGTRAESLAVEWAVQNANVVRQAAIANHTLDISDRDSLMAANLDWHLARRPPGTRAVVWAHDMHVSRGGDPETSFYDGATMGAYLSRTHGDDYRVFGLETYGGEYTGTASLRDYRIITATAFPAPVGSVEEALHRVAQRLGAAQLITDLRPARRDPNGAWLMERRPIRSIGYAAYDYAFEQMVVLPREFDALIFIDRTSGSRLLPR
jgi:erythromycin esterase